MSVSPQSLARTRDKRSLRIPRKFEDFSLVTSGEVPCKEVCSTATMIQFGEANKFYPTITISNGVRISPPNTTKPLLEKKPSPPPPQIATPAQPPPSSLPKSSSRKKSKGFSLMIKPTTPGEPFQNNNTVNRSPVPQTATKYYNNLTQNMQYGTRLMLNEPLYLPKSVSTIAPLTISLQQIANQARRPPFLSKRAEAYYNYQEERKFSHMMSNFTALIRITKYLDLKDLLNLRRVNKIWKSIVDCDAVWKRVSINSSDIADWNLFAENILCRYRTTDLMLNELDHSGPTLLIVQALARSKLKHLSVKTVNSKQNMSAMELLCGLNASRMYMRISWKVRVVVRDDGSALVRLSTQQDPQIQLSVVDPNSSLNTLYYCYKVCPELLRCDNVSVLVELSDLEDLYNHGAKDISTSVIQSAQRPCVDIKPI